jgi:hypothetical protein
MRTLQNNATNARRALMAHATHARYLTPATITRNLLHLVRYPPRRATSQAKTLAVLAALAHRGIGGPTFARALGALAGAMGPQVAARAAYKTRANKASLARP